MADKIKDADDEMLEALMRSEPIADDGFSDKVMRRIHRGLWLRRLAPPIAVLIGGSIAVKPLAGLIRALHGLLTDVSVGSVFPVVPEWMPPVYQIVLGGMLLAVVFVGVRLLND